jgi:hypothetical protein
MRLRLAPWPRGSVPAATQPQPVAGGGEGDTPASAVPASAAPASGVPASNTGAHTVSEFAVQAVTSTSSGAHLRHAVQVRSTVGEPALDSNSVEAQVLQGRQVDWLGDEEKEPAAHAAQTRSALVEAAVETYEPRAQLFQGAHEVAPAADQDPETHGVQADRPVPSAEKVPAGQALQEYPPLPPSVHEVPVRQGLAPPVHVPDTQTSAVVQVRPSKQALPFVGAQVPFDAAPAAALHTRQSFVAPPPQAVLQHTPSTQKPEPHCSAEVHAVPFAKRRRPKYAAPSWAFP